MSTSPLPFSPPQYSRLLDSRLREPYPEEAMEHPHPWVEALLQDALRERASDIHLDPLREGYQLRFRIDGLLVDVRRLDLLEGQRIGRSCKSHANLDPAFTLRPRDGRAQFEVNGTLVSLRVATAPSALGEKVALRLLPTELNRLRLSQLGLSMEDHEQLKAALEETRGMIVVSGPTGSGKTSTAYALLRELHETRRCLATVEDPVEYVIEGVTQVQVNERAGLTFCEGVKGLLRLDPDVIMMGEMRDAESARAALDGAGSGHIFLTTLHARDAAGSITALRNFGLRDYEIAATVEVVVAQRLVRRLCPACRREVPTTEADAAWLRFHRQPVPGTTWEPVGCAECGPSGFRGRIGIFEVWRLRKEETDLVLQHADEHTLRSHTRRRGTLSLVEDDLRKVAEGVTTLSEFRGLGGFGFYPINSEGAA